MGAVFENIPKKKIVTETVIETVEIPVYIGTLGSFNSYGISEAQSSDEASSTVLLPSGVSYITMSGYFGFYYGSTRLLDINYTLYPGQSYTYKCINNNYDITAYILISLSDDAKTASIRLTGEHTPAVKYDIDTTAYGESA